MSAGFRQREAQPLDIQSPDMWTLEVPVPEAAQNQTEQEKKILEVLWICLLR